VGSAELALAWLRQPQAAIVAATARDFAPEPLRWDRRLADLVVALEARRRPA
jgi:hypothetical protein